MKIYLQIVLFYLLLPVMLWGQLEADTSFLRIEENFLSQLEVYPQEKIHLHTDRDFYVPGEQIWFKAYVVDALTHQYRKYNLTPRPLQRRGGKRR